MKNASRFLSLVLLVCLLLLPLFNAQAALSNKEAEQRFNSLSKELRCLVCQNESLAESPAGLADDLRQEVRAQINTGKTDEEIKNYLVDRYGYFILYKPPFIGPTLLLWIAPFLILFGLGGWLVWQLIRKEKMKTSMQTDTESNINIGYEKELAKIKKEFEQEQE